MRDAHGLVRKEPIAKQGQKGEQADATEHLEYRFRVPADEA